MIPFSVQSKIRDMQSAKRALKQPFVNKRDHELIKQKNTKNENQISMNTATGQENQVAVR
jgi:hypothetical protein